MDGKGGRWLFALTIALSTAREAGAAGEELWVQRVNGAGNVTDVAFSVAVDQAGNVYVTGYATGSGTAEDYTTVKYDPSGNLVWLRTYNGPGNGVDIAHCVAVDAAGNVYVTGESDGATTLRDFATVKYSSAGVELWVARHDDLGGNENAAKVVVDGAGNVYVTGSTVSDFVTVKYGSDGAELWVATYDGPGSGLDQASDLAVDGAGNVHVAGGSAGVGTGLDYATIKYASSGAQLWVARHNGSANGDDAALALALDGDGNVYVTGEMRNLGTNLDYVTVKYNSSGTLQWTRSYTSPYGGPNDDGATAIAVDSAARITVTGHSWGRKEIDIDYATIQYDGSGNQLWVQRYDGSPSFFDRDWAEALAVDGSDNVLVTGVGATDYLTIKYNSGGRRRWVRQYTGPAQGDDYAFAIAVDGAGNSHVTGRSAGVGTGMDYATVKYAP